MSWDNKVVWSEGMFLKAQHFQQFDRYVEKLVRTRVAGLRPFSWGVTELLINQPLLGSGKFAVSACRGIMPDGTPFAIPEDAEHPQPLDLEASACGHVVHLALPVRQPGGIEAEAHEQKETTARYAAHDFDAADGNAGSSGIARLRVGRLRLRLLLDTADLSGFVSLGLGRVAEVRADRSVLLERNYIAPTLGCAAAPALTDSLNDLLDLMRRRGDAMAARIIGPATHDVGFMSQLLRLQVINRYEPLLRHYAQAPETHPETLFAAALQMSGELATLSDPTRRPPALPGYRHNDLQASFSPLWAALRRLLEDREDEIGARLLPIRERSRGIRIAEIEDRALVDTSTFVLAIRADLPAETVRLDFPHQVEIGPGEQIDTLVRVALPGIGLRTLPAAPHQIPFTPNTTYFELERGGDLWRDLAISGSLAIHVTGDLPNLQMELWAVRS